MINLKECYELSLETGLSKGAKEILDTKINKLPQEEMDASQSGCSGQPVMNAFLDSGEKEYLQALQELQEGRGETQRLEALRLITNALRLSPADPRFLALAEVLEEAER